jgi:acyl-CoA synthetase (AMP-forming)/AMP-acid ligase II
LDRWAEGGPTQRVSEPVFPLGNGAEFIRTVLSGWRSDVVVCPLEEGQTPPDLTGLPAGCAHIKTTSATTGRPRSIAFSGEQLAADAENIRATMGLRPEWPNLAAISLGHSYGFSNLVLPLLLQGVPMVLCGSGFPEAVRRAATLVSDATLPGVPVLWRQWVETNSVPGNIRLGISAGAPLPVALERQARARCGVRIHNFYGASECGGIAYDRSAEPRADPALVGEPLAGVSVSVREDGLLVVRSAAVGESYWPEPDARLGRGQYETADMAEIIDGRVYLRGRAADLIHVSGRKLAPETVELVLSAHPAVRDCLVVGLPHLDELRGDLACAVVVLKAQATATVLADFLREHLAEWQIPRRWHFVDSVETDVRGKSSRTVWRERLSRG